MAKNEKYTTAQVIKAIGLSRGLVTQTARRLKCEPKTVRRYVNKYPTVKAALDEARCGMLDKAEGKLYDLIASGNFKAISYYLSTQGAERGYNMQLIIAKELAKLKSSDEEYGLLEFAEAMAKLTK